MNSPIAWLTHHSSQLLFLLLDAGAKGSVLLLAALAVTSRMGKRSAAGRHFVWALAMAALLVLPVFATLVPAWKWRLLPAPTAAVPPEAQTSIAQQPVYDPAATSNERPSVASPQPPASDLRESPADLAMKPESETVHRSDTPAVPATEQRVSRPAPEGGPAPARSYSLTDWLALLWLAGALATFLPVLVGGVAVRVLTARARQITSGPWIESFDRLRGAIGVRPVMLLETADASMPMAWGLLRPTLLLPARVQQWDPERRRVVLAHELAHVRRMDCLTQWVAHLACCIHWFNPLAWMGLRKMRAERERACDDLVLRHGAKASEYANHLLEIARTLRAGSCTAMAAVAMARPSQLEGRLLSVLDQERRRNGPGRLAMATAALAVLVALGPLAAVRLAPRAGSRDAALTAAVQLGQQNPQAAAPPAPPVQGWTPAVDPPGAPLRLKADLRESIPAPHKLLVATASRPSPFVLLVDHNWPKQQTWSLLDLRTGAVSGLGTQVVQLEELVLSADGKMLAGKLLFPKSGFEVWSLSDRKRLAAADPKDAGRSLALLGFLDGDQLLTYGNVKWRPRLDLWDSRTGVVVHSFEPAGKAEAAQVAISPGGKFIAVVADEQLKIFDAAGRPVGAAPLPPSGDPELATIQHEPRSVCFSPDGKELAALCGIAWHADKFRLLAWDLASGRVVADLIIPALKDERWTRKEHKFEYLPGGAGWRYNSHILDRASGKSIYTLPPLIDGSDDELLLALDASHVLQISSKRGGPAQVASATLPHDQLAKATQTVRSGGREIDAKLPPLTGADSTAAPLLASSGGSGNWSLQPDLASASTPANSLVIPLKYRPWTGGDELRPRRIVFSSPQSHIAAVTYWLGRPRGAEMDVTTATIERIDLNTRRPVGTLELAADSEALDLSPDGKLLLVRTAGDRVDLYSVEGPTPRPIAGWRPYEKEPLPSGAVPMPHENDVIFGGVLDATHVLTCGAKGKLLLWEVPGCKPVYAMQLAPQAAPRLSCGRKYLAVCNGSGVSFIDAASGRVLAALPDRPGNGSESIAFSPRGDRLARYTRVPYGAITVWDLKTGQTVSECLVPKPPIDGSIAWAGEGYVMAGRELLVDLALHVPVWQYQSNLLDSRSVPPPFAGLPAFDAQPDGRFWCITTPDRGQPPALAAFPLPHEPVKQETARYQPDALLAVHPGEQVAIEVNGPGDAVARRNVIEGLSQRLTDAGYRVLPENSPAAANAVHLVADVTFKGTKQVSYHLFGRPGQETVNVPLFDCKLSFRKDGATVWEVTSAAGSAPFFAHLKQGQTIQQYVDELNANPGSGFFQTCALPHYVARQLDTIGVSRLTATGPQPVAR